VNHQGLSAALCGEINGLIYLVGGSNLDEQRVYSQMSKRRFALAA
jgi:hypothetical protein